MKKKLAAVMICAAMVAMLGVGCGSKSSDDSSSIWIRAMVRKRAV